MCLDCTKLYIQNKRTSNFITDELCLNISEFPYVTREIVSANKIFLFADTNAYRRKNDLFETSLSSLYYESFNSPFLLWKFYLDVLSRVVFNQTNKHVLLMLLSGNETDCRKFTVCTITKIIQECEKLKLKQFFTRSLFLFLKGCVSYLVLILIHSLLFMFLKIIKEEYIFLK